MNVLETYCKETWPQDNTNEAVSVSYADYHKYFGTKDINENEHKCDRKKMTAIKMTIVHTHTQ